MHEGLKRRGWWTGLAQWPLIASLPQRAVCDQSSFLSGGLHMRVHLTEKLAKTTQRYAHLMDSPLRAGVDAVGGLLRPRLRLVED